MSEGTSSSRLVRSSVVAASGIRLPASKCGRPEGYSTLCHELVHWSGANHRLNRTLKTRFGSEAYAAEELIAELGAAFLCADLKISLEPRPDHAAYVATWLKVLKNDTRAIFTAASKAQQAVQFLHGLGGDGFGSQD